MFYKATVETVLNKITPHCINLSSQRHTARSDVFVKIQKSLCLVLVELTRDAYAHQRESLLCFLFSAVKVTPMVHSGCVNRIASLRLGKGKNRFSWIVSVEIE